MVHCLAAVKYLYKYLTKGPDRQVFSVRRNPASDTVPEEAIRQNDEISEYEDGRYISAAEAFWRIYGFEIHEKFPPVSTLPVHAENEQTVMFNPDDDSMMNAAAAGSAPGATKLLAYFTFVQKEGELAADLRYVDMPRYCTWETKASARGWKWRKAGIKDEKGRHLFLHLGRMPYFAPSGENRELFHIRLLLAEKPATSFEDLRTVDGQLCGTFYEACVKLGLLDDDNEQTEVMTEVAGAYPPHVVRETFVSLLLHCTPSNPKELLDAYIHSMAEDIYLRLTGQRLPHNIEVPPPVYHGVLSELEEILQRNNRSLKKFDLPEVDRDLAPQAISPIIADETLHDFAGLAQQVQDMEPRLTQEQNAVYQSVLAALELDLPAVFMVDACGGSGKTYLLNLILRKVRSQQHVALATAFSGIAATLLDKGRTLHGR